MRRADGPRAARPGAQRSIGQSLVEFALVFPVFVLVFFAIVDGARLVFAYNTVAQAAREAARLAAVQAVYIGATGSACSAPVCPASTAVFRTNVLAAVNRMTVVVGTVPSANVWITCTAAGAAPTGSWTGGNDCASGNVSGNVVSVRIAVPIQPLTPYVAIVVPQVTLAGSATMALP